MAVDFVAGRAATTVITPARSTEPTDRPTRARTSRWLRERRAGAIGSGWVQPVAESPDSGDGHRRAQFLADLGHVDVNRAGVAVPAVAPHAVEDLLAGQGPPVVLGQVAEQLELLAGQVADLPVGPHLPPPEVDGGAADLDHLKGGGRGLRPPQDRLHPGHQLPGGERLGEVVVGAELEAEDPVDLRVPGGEEDDGDAAQSGDGVGPQPLAHLEAVDAGQAHIEDDEAGPLPFGGRQPVLPGAGLEHPEPLLAEVELDEVGDVDLVVDDQDGPAGGAHERDCFTSGPGGRPRPLGAAPAAATATVRRAPASRWPPPRSGGTPPGSRTPPAARATRRRSRRTAP